jgi:hypothetical protein
MKDLSDSEDTKYCGVSIETRLTTSAGWRSIDPAVDRRVVEPKSEASAADKGGVILRPVTDV